MKVYGQLERAQIEALSADPTGTGLVQGRVWFNTTVGEYKYYDGSATQVLADIASAQTLLLKTLTDPTFDASTIYDHIATPASPAAGKIKIYAKSDDNIYVLNSAGEEIQLGSGSGGGLDTYYSENFDRTQASDLSYGSNATFLTGGGSESTQAADETVAPISGSRSLSYTHVAGSLNDWGALPAHTLDSKQKGNTSGLTAYTTYSGDDDDMQLVLYDVNTSAVLDTVLVKASTTPLRHFFSAPVAAAATSLRVGYQVLVENIGAKLVLDDIELSTDPFVVKDVALFQSLEYLENTTNFRNLGATSGYVQWSTSLTSSNFIGDDILSVVDGTNITEFHALRDCNLSVTFSVPKSVLNAEIHLYKNGSLVSRGTSQYAANQEAVDTFTIGLSAGDYIDFRTSTGAAALTSGASSYLHITASAAQPSIITPARVNLTEWTSFTSVFEGSTTDPTKGTIDYDSFHYRRVGDSMEIHGSYRHTTAGTAGSGTYLLRVPGGLTIDTSKLYTVSGSDNGVVGSCQFGAGENYGLTLAYSSTQLSFSAGSSTIAEAPWSSTFTGNTFGDINVRFSFHARVPILEWAGASTEFLAALPFYEEILDATGSGSFTGGSVRVTRVNKNVTITLDSALTFAAASAPASAVNFLPSWAIPRSTKNNVYSATGTGILETEILTDGRLTLEFRTWAGATTNLTSTNNLTISYNV